MPASTSTLGRLITEIARLDGVPPNMSVRMATPSPLSTRLTASMMSLAALLDVVVGPDRDGLDLPLGTDHVLQRRAELDGEAPVGHKNETDHRKLLAGAFGAPHERAPHHDHPEAPRKGFHGGMLRGEQGDRSDAPVFGRELGLIGYQCLPAISRRVQGVNQNRGWSSAATPGGGANRPMRRQVAVLRYHRCGSRDAGRGQPLGIGGGQIDHESDDRLRLEVARRIPRPRISISPASAARAAPAGVRPGCRDGRGHRRPGGRTG